MIATRRGLAIAAAIAAVLALALAIDLQRTTAPRSPFVIPDLDPASITELAWQDAVVVRDDKSRTGWKLIDPIGSPIPPGNAEAETIDAAITALRGAHWHRRADAAAAGATTSEVAVTVRRGDDTEVHRIAIGQPIAGTEQQWLVDDGDALLVDAWVARALAPDRLKLHVLQPLAHASSAKRIKLYVDDSSFTFTGRPRAVMSNHPVLVAAPLMDALERAMADIRIVRIPRRPLGDEGKLRVSVGDIAVAGAGPCPDDPKLVAIYGTDGRGCIEASAWAALASAAEAFATGWWLKVMEPRPVPYEPEKIVLADGSTLDVTKQRIGDRAADPARVAELYAALGTPAEPVDLPQTPGSRHLTATAAGVETILDLYGGGIVARRGERGALRLAEGAYAILERGGDALRDLRIWLEEPTTIATIVIAETRYERERATGEWKRTGVGRDDRATLEQLAVALANPRALGPRPPAPKPGAAAPGPRRPIGIIAVPPVGGQRNHALVLEQLPNACAATSDAGDLLVAPELCALAAKLVPP